MQLFVRSLVFNLLFYVAMILWMIALLPTILLPRGVLWAVIRAWSRFARGLLRVVANIRVEVRGRENLPHTGVLVASKHQSVFETICLIDLYSDPAFIMKRELGWVPLFGWLAKKGGSIFVDRSRGREALVAMTARAAEEAAKGRPIVIYPEGTRRAPGAEPAYKQGIAVLYGKLGVPLVPVALNAGLFWPRRGFLRFPGTIVVEFLAPIPPGRPQGEVFLELQRGIEDASDRLLIEAIAAPNPPPLGEAAAARVEALQAGAV